MGKFAEEHGVECEAFTVEVTTQPQQLGTTFRTWKTSN